MAAYIIIDIVVSDRELYEEYKSHCGPIISKYGGKFLARGGRAESLEGDWQPNRMVIIEFDSLERAKAWWGSDEYRAPRQMRYQAANSRMIVVEGG